MVDSIILEADPQEGDDRLVCTHLGAEFGLAKHYVQQTLLFDGALVRTTCLDVMPFAIDFNHN
jgi:hypothetical protein